MQSVPGAVLLALLCSSAAVDARVVGRTQQPADVHPVTKVISLLQGLMGKVAAEGKSEEVTYTKFERWCVNSRKELEAAIKDGKERSEVLNSQIDGKKVEEALLEEQIAGLQGEILKLEAADRAADADRSRAAALYSEADADLAATVLAMGQAIAALEGAHATTEGLSLAQSRVLHVLALAGPSVPKEQRGQLMAFVQQGAANVTSNVTATPVERPDLLASGDYEQHIDKYAFKSSSVIELLKQLKLRFEDEKIATTKGETNSINAFALAKAAREDSIQKATASKTMKAGELADAQNERAQAEQQLQDVTADLQADTQTLAQTTKACAVKKSEWAERSETRASELEAMKAAVEILSKATGVRTEKPENPVPPPSPVQPPASAALLEVSADPRARAVQLLRASARETHSRALERLAQEIAAHLSGPFDDVNNMVQKLIFHLMDEQKDEDTHKNWCDLELNKTHTSKANKEVKMDELSAKINEASALIQTLTLDVQAANEMVSTIEGHMQESAEIRKIGKEENRLAVKDAQDAQEALANAVAVLEAFYKESGMMAKQPWELLQRGVTLPATPATWAASYTGAADPVEQPDGIVSVLKRVSADFARMESQTMAQEQSDQKIFEEDMKLNAIEKARRAKEADEKSMEKKRQVEKVQTMTASRKHVSDQHEAVTQYLADLQHACVDGDSTYEDRKAARQKEIDALHEAQKILTEAFKAKTISFLQRRL